MGKAKVIVETNRIEKARAEKIAKDLGLPLGAIMGAYLKDFIRNRSVNLSAVPRMTPWLEKRLGSVEKDIAAKKNISGPFESAAELDRRLAAL